MALHIARTAENVENVSLTPYLVYYILFQNKATGLLIANAYVRHQFTCTIIIKFSIIINISKSIQFVNILNGTYFTSSNLKIGRKQDSIYKAFVCIITLKNHFNVPF